MKTFRGGLVQGETPVTPYMPGITSLANPTQIPVLPGNWPLPTVSGSTECNNIISIQSQRLKELCHYKVGEESSGLQHN